MTDTTELTDEQIRDMLDKATDGPWSPVLYDTDGKHWDRGSVRVMRGEYFGRAVQARHGLKVTALVPHCHADSDHDARLIAAAPDLARLALERGAERDAALARAGAAEAERDRLREVLRVAVEYMESIQEDGCPSCGSDCSSAATPVPYCPAKELADDLQTARAALITQEGGE